MQTVVPVDQLVGTTLGEYRIERLLSHGTLGAVYIARKPGQQQSVMITLFTLPEAFSDYAKKAFWARFRHEGQKLIQLRHPHILPLFAYDQYASYPYMVSSFVKGRSLAQILKQQPRFTPQQALHVLKQVTVGLDYIHRHDVVHGLLSPTSLLVDNFQIVQLGGIGLRPILEMYGIERSNHPYAHLYSIAETFLGVPEYLAPECARSEPVDARTDIYSLGIILFEMLSGTRPFTGTDPLAVVLQRLQRPTPSLRTAFPDAPLGLDEVLRKALQRHPEKRFQTVNELTRAFEQALQGQPAREQIGARGAANQRATSQRDLTLPPTVDWFAEEKPVDVSQHGIPTKTMGYLSAIEPASVRMPAQPRQVPDAPTQAFQQLRTSPPEQSQKRPARIGGEDPFALRSAAPAKLEVQPAVEAKQVSQPTSKGNKQASQPTSKGSKQGNATKPGRRKVVALLTAGSVVAIAGLGFGGVSLAHKLQQPPATQAVTTQKQTVKSTPPQAKTSAAAKGAGAANPQSTKAAKSTSAVTHTGTVVGTKMLATNSAQAFTNPADGNESLLIHLANGTFVAGERACTHQGVPVNYNPATGKLVCPRHGAIFDPANQFAVLQGPAMTPLKVVTIKVNNDGTITV